MALDTKSERENMYEMSWANPLWSVLTAANILDYFCDLSNPFYDRECNNEIIRMQRLSADHLTCMTGLEYYLHHAQEPILYIIRKQTRLSSTEVTPLAYYYIINGSVLQAPDLTTLLNSRLQTTINGLNKTLTALAPFARYRTADGTYSWDDTSCNGSSKISSNQEYCGVNSSHRKGVNDSKQASDLIPGFNFAHAQRMDYLLADWARRFPLPMSTGCPVSQNIASQSSCTQLVKDELAVTSSSHVSTKSTRAGQILPSSSYPVPSSTTSPGLGTFSVPLEKRSKIT